MVLTVYDANNQPRRLGNEIGSGGQGDVFALNENPNIVVKIFHPDKLREQGHELREKISAQTKMTDLIREPFLSWPQIEVFNDKNEWIGYAMKRAHGEPLSTLGHAMLYLNSFPGLNRMQIVTILINLLDTLKKLHRKKIYIGDINLGNFLADPKTSKVYFIDTDSYQITSGSSIFPCPVGKPEMTPVEHHGQDFQNVIRTVESDLFSLAILMFQCLMLGLHPYSRVGGGNPVDNLRQGIFPYGKGNARPGEENALPPGPWFTIWSHLTYEVKGLFIRTLQHGVNDPSNRASIVEWEKALGNYYWTMEKGHSKKEIRPSHPKISKYRGSRSKSIAN
ncbi:hypothetical protein D0962_37520 [Leptolyngbyaceae cyanobacterium CCMR0082]|uniref:Protein kinase domain-containing protein n=1 Tax=Adonisia turfae CCMR0082 TaxID=2304604 RepID=A0A6M0SKM6_9CYAN|nr:hypothetical protein [Adonisia turfae]NEZ68363.1 hypothetical protein [Adonisia turfae CCMR0082]